MSNQSSPITQWTDKLDDILNNSGIEYMTCTCHGQPVYILEGTGYCCKAVEEFGHKSEGITGTRKDRIIELVLSLIGEDEDLAALAPLPKAQLTAFGRNMEKHKLRQSLKELT